MSRLLWVLVLCLAGLTAMRAEAAYTVQPGDTLQIEVLEDPSLNRSVLVLPDGSISFPFAGTINVSGRSLSQVRAAITSGISSNFAATPTVSVAVNQLGALGQQFASPLSTVFAMGEVANPGKIDVQPGTTLLQLIAQAGGFTKFAATRRVELHRPARRGGAESIYRFDFTGKNPSSISGSTVLLPGDVVVVPERRLFE